MSVFYQDPAVQLLHGDVLAMLHTLPDNYVQTVVTSPPYYGMRDYGVQGQIGLERTPAAYIAKLVAVFTEVRRVLRKDGTLWLNIGDCYNAGTSKNRNASTLEGSHGYWTNPHIKMRVKVDGIKTKDMLGMPWTLAFALRDSGWYLRSDIIWDKTNPPPESCKDRPTKTHEYVFLLSKSAHYYYDDKAIQEPVSKNTHLRMSQKTLDQQRGGPKQQVGVKLPGRNDRDRIPSQIHKHLKAKLGVSPKQAAGSRDIGTKTHADWAAAHSLPVLMRNKRSVWRISTEPCPVPHFATFPQKLIEPCILAGAPTGSIVLDPFAGYGTTLLVSKKLNRKSIGIEISEDYCRYSVDRIASERVRML